MATARYEKEFFMFFWGVVVRMRVRFFYKICLTKKHQSASEPLTHLTHEWKHNENSLKKSTHMILFFLKVISVPCYGLTMCQFPYNEASSMRRKKFMATILFLSFWKFLRGVVNAISARYERESIFIFYPFLSNHSYSLQNENRCYGCEDNKMIGIF